MTWVDTSVWTPAAIEGLDPLHDLDSGTVVVSAPPTCSSERGALLAILGGLGKEPTLNGVPKTAKDARILTRAWIRGEAVHTVVLRSAQRWRPQDLQATERVLSDAGCQLIPVVTGPLGGQHRSLVPAMHDAAVAMEDLQPTPQTQVARLDPSLIALRTFRLTHVPAIAAARLAGVPSETLIRLPITAHLGHRDRLITPDGEVVLAPGAGRFLSAQRAISTAYKSRTLFSVFGRRLHGADVAWATLRVLADCGLQLPA